MKQESKPLITGDEAQLSKAINAPLLCKANSEDIAGVLRVVMLKLGLRAQNLPNDLETAVLIAHIASNFPGNTVAEIQLAFDMAIAGKLDLPLAEVKCYENFSCLYFSTIMNSYQRWSKEAFIHALKEEPKEQKIFSRAELDDFKREDAERQFQGFLKGLDLRGTSINQAILEKDELINPGETVMEFFKRKKEAGYLNIYVKQQR